MIVGMDFGTTNSGMAVYDGASLRRLPLDPFNENPRILRTALYVTNEQDIYIGREALDRYFEHNVGRPVKLEKVWVGEIEVVADLVYFVQDAYVWADVMSPGRLFLSFKTNLRDHEYTGTIIGHFFYPIESLVAIYLHALKRRAEAMLGQELREVVLGRPVHFADDPQHDNLAQERLLRGAFQAGYEKVYLQREPIAAAYHYASTVDHPQNILVFDFGGGTLDITIMRLGEGVRQVLATGGVPIAGDVFDQKMVRAKLPKHFGEGSKYGPKQMPTPHWIYDTFSSWQTILELQTPDNRRVLEQIEQTSQRPREIRALINLVSSNYGLQMFDEVEKTKRNLSERFGGMIRLDGPNFDVLELVTRREFENMIRPEALRIERHLEETLQASGLRAPQIDAVIRTGGSAEIPLFQQLLRSKFGAGRVHSIDTFGSVTAGLGIIAHGIESGEIEARAYTRADLKKADVTVSRPHVSIVDLELLKRRMHIKEGDGEEQAAAAEALLFLTAANEIRIVEESLPPAAQQSLPLSLGRQAPLPSLLSALSISLDERLLLVTSRYRFLLSSARQLLDLETLGQTLAQLYHFGSFERVCAISPWQPLKEAERLLLVTSLGHVRSYPTEIMVAAIEAPVPLTFEQPLPGDPLALLPASRQQQLLLLTDSGRGVRYAIGEIPSSGLQAFNRDDDEQIIAAIAADAAEELALITANGYARRLPVEAVIAPEKVNTHGRVLISRRPVRAAAVLRTDQPIWLVTNSAVHAVEPEQLSLTADSTRSEQLLKLERGQEVLQLLRKVP